MPVSDQHNRRPRLFYGWIMVVVAFVTLGAGAGGLAYSYSVVIVTINQDFEASRLQQMLPMTLMMLGGAIAAPYLGPKIDKYPLRRFMLAGAACLALGIVLLSLAPAMEYVIAIYGLILAPVHALLGTLCSSVLISRWFKRRLSLAMGIASIGVSAGGFVLPPLIEWLASSYGWRHAFQLLSLLAVITLMPLITLVVDRPELKGLQPDGGPLPADDEPAKATGAVFNKTSTILRNRNFWLVSLCVGMLFGIYAAILSNLLPVVMLKGLSSRQGAFLVSTISGVGIAGKLLFGMITDRIDLRIGLAITIVLVISGISVYMLGSEMTHFLWGSVALGLAVGNMLPVWSALIAALFGVTNYGRVMGLMHPIHVVFNVCALPLTGFLFDRPGSYTLPFSLFLGVLTVALLCIPAIQMPKRTS